MVALNPLESAALICAFEDTVLQLNILSVLDGDRGRDGATPRPLTDETDLALSDRLRRQRVRIKIMFERLIGRLFYSADIGSLIEGGLSLAGSGSETAEMEGMEGEPGEWQDAADARRKIVELEGEIAAARSAIATFELVIPQLKEEDRLGVSDAVRNVHISRRWADARLQLQQRTHCRLEDDARRLTQDTRVDKRREHRVHHEIVRFLTQVTQDLKEETDSWDKRYNEQSARWNKTLKELVANKEEHAGRLSVVAEQLAKRTEFCAGVLRNRERRRQAAEATRRRKDAATRIQSWWRGHMVRRGFGALRKKLKQKQHKTRSAKS